MIRERRCFLYCLATAVATAVLHSRIWPTPYIREADCAALAQSALVVPGGGISPQLEPPQWVKARLARAAELYFDAPPAARPKILLLSSGTPHKPMPVGPQGFQLSEAECNARYLLAHHSIPADDVWEESWSLDTIGNAFMARVMHLDLARARRVVVITNDFHMARTRAIFEHVFSLSPEPSCGAYSLRFDAVADVGVDASTLQARIEREARSIGTFRERMQPIRTVPQLHAWLFANHTAYASQRLLLPREPLNSAAVHSY